MTARPKTLFRVLSSVLVLSFVVCGGLSLFCPMLHPATAEASSHPSHSDRTMPGGGGCPDSLAPSAEQLDNHALCAAQVTEPISLEPDSTALGFDALACPCPDLWGLPRYTLLSTFRI